MDRLLLLKGLVGGLLVALAIIVLTSYAFVETSSEPRVLVRSVCFENGACIEAEIADSPESRARGLMERDSLNPDSGMLLVFDESGNYSIWMKNMKFGIDVVWIDAQGRIVGLEAAVPPCAKDSCSVYSTPNDSQFILELPEDSISRFGLRLNQKAPISGFVN